MKEPKFRWPKALMRLKGKTLADEVYIMTAKAAYRAGWLACAKAMGCGKRKRNDG